MWILQVPRQCLQAPPKRSGCARFVHEGRTAARNVRFPLFARHAPVLDTTESASSKEMLDWLSLENHSSIRGRRRVWQAQCRIQEAWPPEAWESAASASATRVDRARGQHGHVPRGVALRAAAVPVVCRGPAARVQGRVRGVGKSSLRPIIATRTHGCPMALERRGELQERGG
ncbi:hypothetical protein PHLGIDRAFT_420863 [Phlebiopsis gigantea 11061_1 CR5-6]|uniref:Uncharacterized protein n=1 Tax=Phlebiopsis gigantea (strain 11061_1 CR5-6) TaxID=745531 RepID=A0A0C3NQK1_PHLG1|nr:hypothetical protein PHLGIDRAFT_420863 [Phlebiopsis gigantea 11061_1 CR5-6]